MNKIVTALHGNTLKTFILSVFAIAVLFGCALKEGPGPLQADEVMALNSKSENMATAYVLGVGDEIAVTFFYKDRLNDEVTIRPDGKISLQLIGDVKAAGLTPKELESELVRKYNAKIESPELVVIVKGFAAEKVYIGGEVARPGLINKIGMLRALDAVIRAGGALDSAKLENVVLLRYNGSHKPDVYSLNLNKVINGELPDITLRPYDIIYVSKTTIAKMDDFVDQYIYQLLPIQLILSFPYNLNSQVDVIQR